MLLSHLDAAALPPLRIALRHGSTIASQRLGAVRRKKPSHFLIVRTCKQQALGPNRAGKTTAMRAIFGLVGMDAGGILWDRRVYRHGLIHSGPRLDLRAASRLTRET